MTNVPEIRRAIMSLTDADYAELREWFAEMDWERWDKEIESDSRSGRLEFLDDEAEDAKRNGSLREL